MPDFNFLLLHVEDHAASAAFYAELLEIPIIEQKSDFAMLPLRDGVMLGLWSRETVEPKSTGEAGASEIAWRRLEATRLTIIQVPTRVSFGTTFVALDPDGHRLRVFAPEPA